MRARRIILWIVSLVIGVPLGLVVLALVVVLVGINIGPGQRLIEQRVSPLTGGMVQISGLSGALPQHLKLVRLAVKDSKGVWLELDNFELRWSPLSLVGMDAHVKVLSAERLALLRKPISDTTAETTETQASSSPSKLNIQVDLDALKVSRIEIGPDFTGKATLFSLNGHAHIASIAPFLNGVTMQSLPKMDIALQLARLDAAGGLTLSAQTPKDRLALAVTFKEGVNGFATTLGQLPQLDPVDMHLNLAGPRTAAALDFGLSAGPITASSTGQINLYTNIANLHVKANAPAMTLKPGIGWNAIALNTDLHGPLKAPAGQGLLDIDALTAGGASIGHLHATFDGTEAAKPEDTVAHLQAALDGLRIPGSQPTLLASAPLTLDVTAHPLATTLPVVARIDHPLMHVAANVDVKPAAKGHVTLALPDLHPLAAIGSTDLSGSAALAADFAMPVTDHDDLTLESSGTISVTGGQPQALHLIGKDGHLALQLSKSPANVLTVKSFGLDGQALHLLVSAVVDLAHGNTMQTKATVALPDLRQASPALLGNMTLTATADGPTDDLAVKAGLEGEFGTKDVAKGPVALDADFQHLPGRPQGTLTAHGTLDHAPLALDTAVQKTDDGAFHLDLNKLSWNSLTGQGKLRLPNGAKVPLGDLDVSIKNLSDFQRLIGQAIKGHLALSIHTTEPQGAPPQVKLGLDGALGMAQASVQALNLKGTISNPIDDPAPDLTLDLTGVRSQDITGKAHATVKGPQSAMAVTLNGAFQNVMGSPANVDAAVLLNLPKKTVRVDRLTAMAKEEYIRLGGPANVSFGDIMGVDHLRATLAPQGVAPATIDIAGSIKPRLALTATVDRLTPAIAKPFAPELAASGVISAKANLAGTIDAPTGTVALTAHGLKMQTGPAASLPAAEILANIGLAGKTAKVDVTLGAGPKVALAVRGTAPLSKEGAIALATTGHVDLSVANGVLGASGMATKGQVGINLNVAGTASQPRATGRVELQNVSFDHYAQGVRLTDINGAVVASGDSLTLEHVLAHAGPGTIALDGTVGIFRPGLPVDIKVISDKARPVSSDLVTAVINTDLHIHGQATTRVDVDGKIVLPSVTVNIPNSMPASVAQLDVVRPGQKAPDNTSSLIIGLGIDVISPGQFVVQGHGLDAEMQGRLHVRGTSSAPSITGGFDLKRGNFNLAGINLNFTHGRVAFNGTGVNHKLDPTLDFRADRNAKGTLASLLVTGYASAPKIDFSSVPTQPRDEVMAILLFGTDAHSLSTTQLAELAAAVAQLAGGSSFDPLGKVRNALGLDRLAVGGGGGVDNGGTSVEAGKYVMKGVYVGAKQATSGSGTQAQVQIDLTKRLKLNTTVGTGGQVTGFTTPENDPGSSVGLSYGFDY
ncbi:translocation/assembly module TamB domain-containing protein [Gluconobacter cerinus]|uniref:translocation/assembly module TamB domain-containing protein n=1 Tax=Gluconobacter cerinus TaxID=38307 RepID=UPI001B8AB378|nr:translocation/assembly module TamB domain-containing protein [Gluconobacter cerinus]MBS1029884.1 translocation/assembly module TamB domain-containing protein [Gluconobacter cerinus]